MRLVRARSDQMARSDRGEIRHWKVPGLSKLRIGGSVGKAAEKLKHAKVMGIPVMAGIQMATGNVGGAVLSENARAGGDWDKTKDFLKEDVIAGAKNVPLAMGVAEATGGMNEQHVTNGVPGVPGSPGSNTPGIPPIPGLPGGAGSGGGGGGGGTDWLSLGLGAASGLNAANLAQKSEDYATKAYGQAQDNWRSREPLRMAGVSGMLNAGPSQFGADAIANMGDISGRNPFAKPALRMAPPLVSSAPTPQTQRDVFALGDPNKPALPPGTKSGMPLTPPPGPTPGVSHGFPEGLAYSDWARDKRPWVDR